MKIELTENPTNEEVSEAWPDDVCYKGKDIFEAYIDALDKIGNHLAIGSEIGYEEETYDDTGGWYAESYHETIDGQESYLGYIPSLDKFISGWDMWGIDDNESGMLLFSFNTNFEITEHEVLDGYKRMMYYSSMWHGQFNSNLQKLESVYPDIIHIRLD